MPFTNNEIATYLFCAQLSQTKTPPLTIIEWNAVVKSLRCHNLEPDVLLAITASELISALTEATTFQKSKIISKVEARQKLGISILELEELVHQGYGIMFRSQMPLRIKKLTQKFLPAFFYTAGDNSILLNRLLGVVGARDATPEELSETTEIAREAVSHGVAVISGGAKGVDTTAVEAALQNGGQAVVFPSDGLSKWIKKSSIRQYIMNGQLLLMSTQKLDAPFSGSYAMQRNKFIHAPSDAVLVASSKISGMKSSGTWEGVVENLKMKWSPLYVIGNSEGVKRLKAEGNAKPFSSIEDIFKISERAGQVETRDLKGKLTEAIEIAQAEGLDKGTIEKTFLELLAQYFKQEARPFEERSIKSQKSEEVKQLSLEDMLIREVD